jgi:hypothetical protein
MGLLLFLLAFVVRLTLIAAFHPYRDLTRYELERTALSLATTGVFGNPYAIPTGPTAHVSPGYTIILAAIFYLFGTGIPAEVIKEVLAAAVTALQCALLPAIAEGLLLGRTAGLIAGLICALFPVKPFVQIDGDWETPYTALFIMFTSVLAVQTWRKCRLTVSFAVLNGLVWGFALLFASVLLPIFAAFVLAGTYFCRTVGYKRYFSFAAIQIAAVAFCLLPWIIRNSYALGAPIATRSNFGLELRVSNNNEATPDQLTNYLSGVYDRYHPLQNKREALKVKQLGEVAYNREAADEAKSWIRAHRSRFIRLCIGRARCFWFYPDHSRIKALFGDLTAVLGLIGFFLLLRSHRASGIAVGIILLLYPAPNYLIHVGARQRYPIDWLLTALSILPLLQIWSSLQNRQQSTTKRRVAAV